MKYPFLMCVSAVLLAACGGGSGSSGETRSSTSSIASSNPSADDSSASSSAVSSSESSTSESSVSSSSIESSSSSSASSVAEVLWDLRGNLGTHDPTIIEEDGVWYEYQTGVGIYGKTSADGGITWDPLPSLFGSELSWWEEYVPEHENRDVWAPDVHHYQDRVWMYYSISTFGENTSAIGLTSTPTLAANDWRDDGVVIATDGSQNYNAIDPNLFISPSDEPWLVFGSYWSGIKLTRLDPQTMKPEQPLELTSVASRGGGAIEAPVIVYHDGYFYLFLSIDRCCANLDSTYKIVYGRASNVTGPYLDKSGTSLMDGGGTLLWSSANEARLEGPGGGQDVHMLDDGSTVMAWHIYDVNDHGHPKLAISNIGWDDEGWPELVPPQIR